MLSSYSVHVYFQIRLLFLLFSWQVMSNSITPWTAARQASLSLTISWSLPKFMSIEADIIKHLHYILCNLHLFLIHKEMSIP